MYVIQYAGFFMLGTYLHPLPSFNSGKILFYFCLYVLFLFFFAATELSQPSDADETGLRGSRENTATGVHTSQCYECNKG